MHGAANAPRNRLANQTSAYLLQHAGNPVDWYPWGDEALLRARELDQPILLSVGYSACHWCHVMERESFEDEQIATLMNGHFVCIKVDREERPDIDHLYMTALQAMTGRGGWPMTMFLTTDAKPFFAGTYFPPRDRGGMAGFARVLEKVAETWKTRRDEVEASAGRMVEFLAKLGSRGGDEARWSVPAASEAAASLVSAMDTVHGGFGRATKFPATMALTLLMETAPGTDSDQARLVRLTLDRMADGGIRDHLGGGFHRYSVDAIWLVPHFEKMLYDQALVARLYADASRFFDEPRYASVAAEILDYVLGEMRSSDGGFWSAQDADSEGEEGKYFVWTRDEVLQLLGVQRGERFCAAYDVCAEGNFEGKSILHRVENAARGLDEELAQDRAELLRRRRARIAPATDRKIVADWNSLVISALAAAGRCLGRRDFLDAAEAAVNYIETSLVAGGSLEHVHPAGGTAVPAFLDDYAFFGRACLDLFAARPDPRHFQRALWCAGHLLDEFLDTRGGGFFFTGSRGESLIARTCDLNDGAIPAGNSVAAELLMRLFELTGERHYREAADAVFTRFLADALRQPYGASHLLAVAERDRKGWRTVVVCGRSEVREKLSRVAEAVYDPATTVIGIEDGSAPGLPAALVGKDAPAGTAVAYVCEGLACRMPATSERELARALRRDGGFGGEA